MAEGCSPALHPERVRAAGLAIRDRPRRLNLPWRRAEGLHPNRLWADPFVFETTPVRLPGSLSKMAEDGDHASQPAVHRPSTFPACAGPRPVRPPRWRWVEVLTPNGTCPSVCFQDSGSAPVCLTHPKWRPWQELHPHFSAFEARPTFCCRHGHGIGARPRNCTGTFPNRDCGGLSGAESRN
jgi:hypothetical protein